MSFAAPWVFLALPLPFLMRWFPLPPEQGGLKVPPQIFDPLTANNSGALPRSVLILWVAWVCFIVALASPQIQRQSDILPVSGRDIVLVMDLSGSMEKQDFILDGRQVTRLEAVKKVAAGFTKARKGDRIGLVIFGDDAYIAQPLTYDVEAVANAISEAQIGISGRSTAISDGLGLAMRRLVESDASSRVVVLLSDGADTSGKVRATDAARLAATHGIRIHTIALGPEDLEDQPQARDAVDSKTLREMAALGNGESFRVRKMEDLYFMAKTLDELEPNPSDRPPLVFFEGLWPWLAALTLIVLAVAFFRRRL